MLAEPRAADLKNRPLRLAGNRPDRAPDVRVVMRHPTACAVKLSRDVCAVHADFAREFEQWQMTLGKIRGLDRPVIDFRVAVQRPVRGPRREERVVPDALQIRRLLAGRDDEINR